MPVKSYAWGIDYQDTYVNLRYVPDASYAGVVKHVPVVAGNITYANGWTYGSNLISQEIDDFSGDNANSTHGKFLADSLSYYGIFRTVLSGNKISGTHAFGFGPFRDIGLEMGGDIQTQNDQFASAKRLLVIGPQFSINLPRGFWTISTVLSKEWGTEAFLPNTNSRNFDPTGEIEMAWAYPFAIGPVPVNFTGFANFVGPKGYAASGDFYHHVEILTRPKLLVDIGDLLGYVPKKIEMGLGYQYWHNMFGDGGNSGVVGTESHSVFVELGYHF